jgi:outer membrane protein assembly factor BamB
MMKKLTLAITLVFIALNSHAQHQPFRFAFISDTHIGSPNGSSEADLRRTVRDINGMDDVAFVVLTGDITELGTKNEITLAEQILDSLDIPFHIIPGNHDTGWSESGGEDFTTFFGYDKFAIDFNGIRFLGCPSGPYVRMSDGHVPRSSILWMDSVLQATPREMPVIFLNHYPINKDLDNWYEITDRLRKHNTIAILCGHGHRNNAMNFDGIPAVMGRSNLRAKAKNGGYNLVDVTSDSLIFSERTPEVETRKPWTAIKIEKHSYLVDEIFPRPNYDINTAFSSVKPKWTFSSDANVISTPFVVNDLVIFGNHDGVIQALSIHDGSKRWSVKTKGAIFSSPAGDKKTVVVGCSDGYIYALETQTGRITWKLKTDGAVLGSPLIEKNSVYIGGSDGGFRSIDLKSGKERWNFKGLEGPVVSTPLLYEGKVIFGAWDRNLYALDKDNGQLVWKWTNGSTVKNYSPASCIPVAHDGVVYIVAPDRYISAIDAASGKTLWRNNDTRVRESIGISADRKFVYGKTMEDTIVAYSTSKEKQSTAWKMFCGYGYEHVPSMLIEKDNHVFFGTKSGVVYAIDPRERKIAWAHKIDNSMVNTVNVISRKQVIAATMDGKVVLLEVE